MVVPTGRPSRFRNFLSRIQKFLTRGQQKKIQSAAKDSGVPGSGGPAAPTEPRRATPAREVSPPAGAAAPRRAAAPPTPTPEGPSKEQIEREQKRIAELRRIEEEARKEREGLEAKTAAQQPPVRDLDSFKERKGFVYSTWFKAFGTFGDLRDMGDSPPLLGEIEELEDFDVPAAFYSSTILGKVKWKGQRERQSLIDELNTVGPWNPSDFRDVYPSWEYRYYKAEMVGDVVVQIFEHKAKQPLTKKDRILGFKPS
jgi:hypothetical protein